MLKLQHAIPFLLLLAGCAVRQPAPRAWRFADRTLIPPGVTSPDLAERTFKATIAVRPNCLESDALTIERRRSSITVTVHREALLRQPRGSLAEWVDRAESQGCIPHGQGSLLAARILESLPLPVGAAQAQAGLQPWFKGWLEENTRRPGFPVITADRRRRYFGSALQLMPAPQGYSPLRRSLSEPLWLLFAATAVLLGLACLNVASLFLARGSARDREIGTRLALGASRSRIGRRPRAPLSHQPPTARLYVPRQCRRRPPQRHCACPSLRPRFPHLLAPRARRHGLRRRSPPQVHRHPSGRLFPNPHHGRGSVRSHARGSARQRPWLRHHPPGLVLARPAQERLFARRLGPSDPPHRRRSPCSAHHTLLRRRSLPPANRRKLEQPVHHPGESPDRNRSRRPRERR